MNPIAAQKAKKEMEKRRAEIKTYTVPIIFAGDVERNAFLRSHYKKFTNSRKTSMYRLQVMKKYPNTVGKFYHDLVEHSGKVTAEHFWMRYDYRCCDLSRVLQELQIVKQESKRNKKKTKCVSSKEASQVQEFKKKAKKSPNMSWMKMRSLKSSENSGDVHGGVEAAATVDTADDEQQDIAGVNHIEAFNQSLGDAHLVDASPAESAQERQASEVSTEGSNLSTVFRSGSNEAKSPLEYMKVPVLLIVVWSIAAIVASVLTAPSSWMGREFGNRICSPIRPGMVLEARELLETNGNGANLVLDAPWWAPTSIKETMYGYLCATDAQGNSRTQTQISCNVRTNKFFRGKDVPYLTVTMKDNGGKDDSIELEHMRSIKTLKANFAGTKLTAEKFNGREAQYDSPWALI
jgi:hypothetical protein